ncbi:MAG: trypsin-like peptidase domain-containing protein, partial [Anaerolineales bacterium]|nr:trypsin-like peptidase domain-containing protein [Anaerolineales bacterium]
VFSTQGTGTGFVFDDNGHIITNNHVVTGSTQFEIVFSDGSRSDAEVIGTDVDSDLAVMRVANPPASARPLIMGDSGGVQVGQFVIAIGNPFQQESSLSFGIVSGLGRSLRSARDTQTGGFYSLPQVIQTDAPINPGNSGGPLLGLDGQVIGVNSAISSETGFNSGVGYAIPINIVKKVVPALIEDGEYVYPYMGVGIDSINLFIQEQLGLPDTRGALVVSVTEEQPAALAGLVRDDVITAINGDAIVDSDGLISYLVFETEVGETVDLTVIRAGETLTIPLTLAARP